MRQILAACAAALIATTVFAEGALAAPTEVNVRIEGSAETLFEGPVASEPHGVRATSDSISPRKLRRCDGINPNDPLNTAPALTPTAASADAMALLGETFDGQWYRSYEDYFLTRWGHESQDVGSGAYWGILVNDVFTNVGGCQYQLDGGDEVLWVHDAFHGRPDLALFPEAAAYGSGRRPLTVRNVAPGEAVPVEVVSYADTGENNPPPAPGRTGTTAFAGARVAPVITGPKGTERIEPLVGQTTDAAGRTSVSFTEPGWHRIKATVGSPGSESAIRSNRIDICVTGSGGAPLEGASTCAETPFADGLRVAAPTIGEIQGPETTPATPPPPTVAPPSAPRAPGSLRLSLPKVERGQLARGRLTIRWSILETGPGVKRWTISSQALGQRGAPWVIRASGAERTVAQVQLPKGATYRLRFAITDALGRVSTTPLGKVTVPRQRHRRHR